MSVIKLSDMYTTTYEYEVKSTVKRLMRTLESQIFARTYRNIGSWTKTRVADAFFVLNTRHVCEVKAQQTVGTVARTAA